MKAYNEENALRINSSGCGFDATNNANITVKWGSPLAPTKMRKEEKTPISRYMENVIKRKSFHTNGLILMRPEYIDA